MLHLNTSTPNLSLLSSAYNTKPCKLNLLKPALKQNNSESNLSLMKNKKIAPVSSGSTTPKQVKFDEVLEHVKCFTLDSCPKFINGQRPLQVEAVNFTPPLNTQLTQTNTCSSSNLVKLECLMLDQTEELIRGKIIVKNVAFHKIVNVRATFDNWDSYSVIKAKYATQKTGLSSSIPLTDDFEFEIKLQKNYCRALETKSSLQTHNGIHLQFAIQYLVNNAEHWDNNSNRNYKLLVIPSINHDPSLITKSVDPKLKSNISLNKNLPIKKTTLTNIIKKPSARSSNDNHWSQSTMYNTSYGFDNTASSQSFGKQVNFESFYKGYNDFVANNISKSQPASPKNIGMSSSPKNIGLLSAHGASPPVSSSSCHTSNSYNSIKNNWYDSIPVDKRSIYTHTGSPTLNNQNNTIRSDSEYYFSTSPSLIS